MKFKNTLVIGGVLMCIGAIATTGYSAYISSYPATATAGVSTLSASEWNKMVTALQALDSAISAFTISSGNVGIGVDPSQKLSVAGIVQSTTGGFKFPDNTVQISAAQYFGANFTSGTCAATAVIGPWAPSATPGLTGECIITPNLTSNYTKLNCSCTPITGAFAGACQFLLTPLSSSIKVKVHKLIDASGANSDFTLNCTAI